MTKSVLFSILFVIQNAYSVSAQVNVYQEKINLIESHILEKNYQKAAELYNNLYGEWKDSIPYIKDYYVASQIAALLDDESNTTKYLEVCFKRGVGMESIQRKKIFKDYRETNSFKELAKQYPTLRSKYESGIDSEYRHKIDSMLERDQKVRDKDPENMDKVDSSNIRYLLELIEERGFPNEKNIGIDTHKKVCIAPFYILLHSLNDYPYPVILEMLEKACRENKFHLFSLARIQDNYLFFMEKKNIYGIMWEFSVDRSKDNILNTGDDVYNRNRKEIGLEPLYSKKEKMVFQKKNGIGLVYI